MMITNEDYIVYLKKTIEIPGVGRWFKTKECLLYKDEDVSSNSQHAAKSVHTHVHLLAKHCGG